MVVVVVVVHLHTLAVTRFMLKIHVLMVMFFCSHTVWEDSNPGD
jgi:hypothetical protein